VGLGDGTGQLALGVGWAGLAVGVAVPGPVALGDGVSAVSRSTVACRCGLCALAPEPAAATAAPPPPSSASPATEPSTQTALPRGRRWLESMLSSSFAGNRE
jgi:hypothetical protein